MAGAVVPDGLSGPVQPKPFHDSVIINQETLSQLVPLQIGGE